MRTNCDVICMKTFSQIKMEYLKGQLRKCSEAMEKEEQEIKKVSSLFVIMRVDQR